MKAKKSDWFIGRWQTESSVILEISKVGNRFRVRAFDKDDGEELVVSKTVWNGKCLRFETYVPTTKYRTRNSLTLVSSTKLIQELTFWEPWEKVRLLKVKDNLGELTIRKKSPKSEMARLASKGKPITVKQ